MKVSGIWSLLGLVVAGLIVADLMLHPTGSKTAFSGITQLSSNTGNQLIGTPAKG
jgi:hypothetical protein